MNKGRVSVEKGIKNVWMQSGKRKEQCGDEDSWSRISGLGERCGTSV